jgi:hypothetical protein
MRGAVGIGADFVSRTLPFSLGDDSLGRVSVGLELRRLRIFLRLRFLVADEDVLPPGENRTSLLRSSVVGADLHQRRLRGKGLGDVRINLGLKAGSIRALCGIWANRKSFLLAPGSRADRVGQQATADCFDRNVRPDSDLI